MRRVLLFFNPIFEQRASQRAITRIVDLLQSSGISVEVHQILSAHSAGDQARQAIEDGFDTILVCGGDGTVFNVLQGVAGTTIPIGILPFGTGNVLAQNLKLPRNPVEAARLLMKAKSRRIPLGRITLTIPEVPAVLTSAPPSQSGPPGRRKSWYFTMTAGMGVHATLMNAAHNWGKYTIGRTSYFLAGANLLLRHRIQPFEIEVTTPDGAVFRRLVCEAIAVRVSDLNRWQPGGHLETPLLRLATVDATGRWGLGLASLRALARMTPEAETPASVRYTDAVRIVFRPAPGYKYTTELLAEADGEVLGASHAVVEMTDQSYYLLWP
jgi:diacylglycerol kinase (ATP)